MKFELSRLTEYSDEGIIKEINRVAILLKGKHLSKTSFNKISKVHSSTIEKRFGGWIKGLKIAGLDESYFQIENRGISKNEVLSELKRISVLLNRKCFTQREFVIYSGISKGVFSIRFGSFGKMMKDAGLDVPQKSRKYSDEERFENLLKVWTYYGRQPTYSEMKQEPSIVGPKAYVTRWGSWTKGLLAFIEKINSDLEISEINNVEINLIKETNYRDRRKPSTLRSIANSRTIPLGLRYDILKRDKFSCVLCGRTPKAHNINLEVDHFIAFNGSNTVPDNLRTLCNECNNGKSNKFE